MEQSKDLLETAASKLSKEERKEILHELEEARWASRVEGQVLIGAVFIIFSDGLGFSLVTKFIVAFYVIWVVAGMEGMKLNQYRAARKALGDPVKENAQTNSFMERIRRNYEPTSLMFIAPILAILTLQLLWDIL